MAHDFRSDEVQRLRVGPDFSLEDVDASSTPGFDGDKRDAESIFDEEEDRLDTLEELLFANGRSHGDEAPSVLLVLQGMDTAGKGGVIRHVLRGLDPQAVHIRSFGRPTPEELEHDFLWRIERALPPAGAIGVFDRSHYEDVLVQRVREMAPPEEIERRYGAIREFEKRLVEERNMRIIKCMLHISKDEQFKRLDARLDRPEKHWKFEPNDIDERLLWDEYMEAYEIALTRTSTDEAPWYCIPADHKWYSRMAVKRLLIDELESLQLSWPEAKFDVDEQKRRLANS